MGVLAACLLLGLSSLYRCSATIVPAPDMCSEHRARHCRQACSRPSSAATPVAGEQGEPSPTVLSAATCADSAACEEECLSTSARFFDGGACFHYMVEEPSCFNPTTSRTRRRHSLLALVFSTCKMSCRRAGEEASTTCAATRPGGAPACMRGCMEGMVEHCGLPTAANAAEHRRGCEQGRLLCRTSAGVTVRARPLLMDRFNDSSSSGGITRHMRSLSFDEQNTVQTAMMCRGPVPRNCPATACSCPCAAVPRVITSYATTMAYVQDLLTAVSVIVPDDNGDDDGGDDSGDDDDGGDGDDNSAGGDCNEHAATSCLGNDGNRSRDLSRPQCAKRVLLIGLGGGLFPLMYRRFCPEGTITTVEIDPSVVEMAVNMFGYQHHEGEQSRSRLVVGDGSAVLRAFALAEATERNNTTTMTTTMPSVARFDAFDAVVIDCFSASPRGSDGTGNVNIIPEGCRSRELYTNAHAVLRPGGKLVQNVIVRGEKKRGVHVTGGGGGTSEEASGGLHSTELTAILDLYRDIFGYVEEDAAVRSRINSTVNRTSNNVVVVGVKGDT